MLGAEVIHSTQDGKPRIDLKLGGANIFIAPVKAGDGVNPPPVSPHQGLDHFGLTVTGIDAIAAELKAKGVEFLHEPYTARPGVRVCFLHAPDGVSIELLDRDPKYS
jgi:catechol 2,3-dioxygenase-like lactoylglutathione lyase family enzyme